MSERVIYWTCRKTSPKRWTPEDGWDTREKAESSAKFYRREYRRPCVVVAHHGPGFPTGEELASAVWT